MATRYVRSCPRLNTAWQGAIKRGKGNEMSGGRNHDVQETSSGRASTLMSLEGVVVVELLLVGVVTVGIETTGTGGGGGHRIGGGGTKLGCCC